MLSGHTPSIRYNNSVNNFPRTSRAANSKTINAGSNLLIGNLHSYNGADTSLLFDKDLKNLNKTSYTIDKSSLKDYDKDWQQILGDEKSRLKKKERDNK